MSEEDNKPEVMFGEARQVGVSAQLPDGKLATINLGGDLLILLVARSEEELETFISRYPEAEAKGWRPVPVMVYERDFQTVSVSRN